MSDNNQPTSPVAQQPTPMMAQYIEIKAANPDSLLFYRMGDFYEMFFGDAEVAARALGIALTRRGKHLGEDIPMCGVPVHAADDYLQKLIRLGHRVAVCEQIEDPAEARKRGSKSVVKRDVVRLVTPGTLTEEKLLEPGRANALAVVSRVGGRDGEGEWAIASVDISTGTFRLIATDAGALGADLARLAPAEIVVPDTLANDDALRLALEMSDAPVQPLAASLFDSSRAEQALSGFYGVASMDAFGTFSRAELSAAAGAVRYIEKTQIGQRPALAPPRREATGSVMAIDAATRTNLEIARRLDGERAGSLLATIDRTVSPLGARLLAERIEAPLTDATTITARHDDVAQLVASDGRREAMRDVLKAVPDMPRALGRLSLQRGGPRDLAAIARGLEASERLCEAMGDGELAANLTAHRDICAAIPQDLADRLEAALGDELPMHARDGGFLRPGYDAELDEQRDLSRDARKIIAALQARHADETGIKNLKVRHNNVLGYFIEVSAGQADALQAAPETFIHRQTMANAMRFTTTELAALESRIADAAGRALAIETAHFATLCAAVMSEEDSLRAISQALAELDVATALAELAAEQGYVRPRVDDSLAFEVVAGRHPVVEQALRKAAANPFVANDCRIGGDVSGALWLLTGPNMGGKSTFLRQNALIAILAQAGSFVPAGAAHIGVVDRLFSRVGAADDLARGRSTFMVEMVETAAILNLAGPRALVILDEIGRGTATYDGLSIAWAAVEHLHEANRCRTLFATHFHELTALAAKLPRMANVTMKVREWEGDVVFLHEVGPGSADRSYGIQVARLAGLPTVVVERARAVLEQLEATARERGAETLVDDLPLFSVAAAPAPAGRGSSKAEAVLRDMTPDTMSPKDALEALYRLKGLVE